MLAVNQEKLLEAYNSLKKKQEFNLSEIEKAAREFAIDRGYDAETTDKFVKYAQDAENGGLGKEERTEFDILNKYVTDVPAPTGITENLINGFAEKF